MKNELQKGVLLFTFIFALLSINYYHDFAPRLPYGVHDEAQADRLAVAIQFHDRGMDFFHPRTYHIYATDGITGIEFPIHSYVAAALGFIFGRDNIPICFRLLTLLIAYFGLLSLYLTAYRRTNDIVSSLFPPLFLFSSPVFVYYACNFMPDAAATSISFIGFYYFMRFYEHKKFKQLITAFVFFTLAALMKTTVAIVLLTVMGYLLLDMLFFKKLIERKLIGKTFLVFAVSLSCILIYYFYNQYLLDKYNGYIFLMRVLPFQSFDEFRHYYKYCIPVKYMNEYFLSPHYGIMAVTALAGLFLLFRNKAERSQLFIVVIAATGVFVTSLIFGHQLIHHDYYFVSMWMPSIIIIFSIFFIEVRRSITSVKRKNIFNIIIVLLMIPLLYYSDRFFKKRVVVDPIRYPYIYENMGTTWMEDGAKKLDALGISRDSTIYVLDENAANVGLLYFDRRGMNAMKGSWEGNIFNVRSYMKDRDIRIMVCNAKKMPAIKETYHQHFDELYKELYMDDKVAVYYLKR